MNNIDFDELEKKAAWLVSQKKPTVEEIQKEIKELGPTFENTPLFVAGNYVVYSIFV